MTAPKRAALAFGCMLLSLAIFTLVAVVPTALQYGPKTALPDIEILPAYLLFSLPGWILALPFVLFFKNADGWRTWAILAAGTAIGPCFVLGLPLLAYGRINRQGDLAAASMALFIGFLTTLFYVLLLRRFSKRALTMAQLGFADRQATGDPEV